MNSIEGRLRAAARTATDMFPHGGELPPLQLPEAAHSRKRLHSGAARPEITAGSRHGRAWLAPLAAAAAVIAVVTALVVPRQIASTAGPVKPPGQVAPATSSQAHKQEQALDGLVVLAVAPATGLQYDQGGKLTWMLHGLQLQSTARCMAALGYHISDQQPPYNLADFADNTQMPDLPRIARTHEFVGGGITIPHYSAAERRAMGRCQSPTVAYRQLVNADQVVNGAWWQVIDRAQASSQVTAAIPALSACATRYGFPNDPYGNAPGPIKSFGDFMGWIAGFLDGASSRGASQSTLNSLARHWTTVFVTCATPIVDIWQRMLLKAQPAFLHQHAEQIARLDQLAWQYLGQPQR